MPEIDENLYLGLGDPNEEQDERGIKDTCFADLKIGSTIYSVKLQGIVSYKVTAMDFSRTYGIIVAVKSETDAVVGTTVKLYDVDPKSSSVVSKGVTYYAGYNDAMKVLSLSRRNYINYMSEVLKQVQDDLLIVKSTLETSESYSDSEWVDAGMDVITKRYGYPKPPVPNEIDVSK